MANWEEKLIVHHPHDDRPEVTNFGGNKRFRPAAKYAPRSESQLLQILRDNRGKRIRAVGRLHSWSDAPVCDEILVDLRYLNSVTVLAQESTRIRDSALESRATADSARVSQGTGVSALESRATAPSALESRATGGDYVDVGAGCQIKRLVRELQNQGGFTLPSIGLIMEQTIAGATATGTHGSGRHSLSHYLQAVRLACYDPATGEPTIRVVADGPELQAARCNLGSLGIVTAIRLPIRRQYFVEEHFRRYDTLAEVLEQEKTYDLQQFFLMPWRWDYFSQHRVESPGPRSWLAPVYRIYWQFGTDLVLHLVVRMLARQLPHFCTKIHYRWILPNIFPQRWKVVDRSDRQLTMRHELFQHIEIEMFVKRSQLAAALEYVVWLLRHMGGETVELAASVRERLQTAGHWESLVNLGGSHLHHYPVCCRKVLPDATLISMASGWDEPCYALSFISYARREQRSGFLQFAGVLATTMAMLFDARPHWGKVCPLPASELWRLYPRLGEFATICDRIDPAGVFRNDWIATILER